MDTLTTKIQQMFEKAVQGQKQLKLQSLKEKELQAAVSNSKTEPEVNSEKPQQEKQKEKNSVRTDGDKTEPSYSDIVNQLNAIRSGKSLKNTEIEQIFKGYVEQLDKNEQKSLYIFLKAVAQALSGQIGISELPEPEDEIPQLATKTKTIKPEVKPVKTEPKTNYEDTTPPQVVPIKPKQR